MSNISKVYLLKVPLENDYKHTLYFGEGTDGKTKQRDYFLSKKVKTYEDFTYQRKDNKIRVPEVFDTVLTCNYVMYQNPAYNNKWFYAFITDTKYISEGVTEIAIETDVMQTWAFDYTMKECFVEREHTNNDSIGANTVPEGLETGEYVSTGMTDFSDGFTDLCYVMASTLAYAPIDSEATGSDKFPVASGRYYNGIYSGVQYFVFDEGSGAQTVVQLFTQNGVMDAVQSIFVAPKFLAPMDSSAILTRDVKESNLPEYKSYKTSKPFSQSHFSNVKNNKLKTFPYCYLVGTNNQGSSAVYRYEDFSTSDCGFSVRGALTPGCSIRMVPTNYKNVSINHDEGINLGKYPICNFVGDAFTNWLTQQCSNIEVQETSGALSIAGGVLSAAAGIVATATGAGAVAGVSMIGGGALAIGSGINQIRSINASVEAQSYTPPQAKGNINCGDVITADKRNMFSVYHMCIKPEFIKIIDDYFSMFGYKTCRVKTPYKNHRNNYWYTKTVDCDLDGNIPNTDIQKIKECYNKGITFWKNASNIGKYSVDNKTI